MAESLMNRLARVGPQRARLLVVLAAAVVVLAVAAVLVVAGVVDDTVEVVATLVVVPVFTAALLGGALAGVVAAALASGVYVVLRSPDVGATGVPSFVLLVATRAIAYGVVAYAGVWAGNFLASLRSDDHWELDRPGASAPRRPRATVGAGLRADRAAGLDDIAPAAVDSEPRWVAEPVAVGAGGGPGVPAGPGWGPGWGDEVPPGDPEAATWAGAGAGSWDERGQPPAWVGEEPGGWDDGGRSAGPWGDAAPAGWDDGPAGEAWARENPAAGGWGDPGQPPGGWDAGPAGWEGAPPAGAAAGPGWGEGTPRAAWEAGGPASLGEDERPAGPWEGGSPAPGPVPGGAEPPPDVYAVRSGPTTGPVALPPMDPPTIPPQPAVPGTGPAPLSGVPAPPPARGDAASSPPIDPETRLWTARYLCDRLAAEQRRAAGGGSFSLVLVQVPDGPLAALSYRRQVTLLRELGHQFVAGGLVDHLVHVPDQVQHWFAVVLPGTDRAGAEAFERRLREGIGGYLRSRGLLLGELESACLAAPDDDPAMAAVWESLIARGDPDRGHQVAHGTPA